MKRKQQAFTLIELMIVVAIIGILTVIALPAYQDYTMRAHVSEGLNLASTAKNGVVDFYQTNNSFPADNTAAGIAAPNTITGNAVKSVAVGASGVITITYNTTVSSGSTIILTPTTQGGSITWACSGGDIRDEWRPANCRS